MLSERVKLFQDGCIHTAGINERVYKDERDRQDGYLVTFQSNGDHREY